MFHKSTIFKKTSILNYMKRRKTVKFARIKLSTSTAACVSYHLVDWHKYDAPNMKCKGNFPLSPVQTLLAMQLA